MFFNDMFGELTQAESCDNYLSMMKNKLVEGNDIFVTIILYYLTFSVPSPPVISPLKSGCSGSGNDPAYIDVSWSVCTS